MAEFLREAELLLIIVGVAIISLVFHFAVEEERATTYLEEEFTVVNAFVDTETRGLRTNTKYFLGIESKEGERFIIEVTQKEFGTTITGDKIILRHPHDINRHSEIIR